MTWPVGGLATALLLSSLTFAVAMVAHLLCVVAADGAEEDARRAVLAQLRTALLTHEQPSARVVLATPIDGTLCDVVEQLEGANRDQRRVDKANGRSHLWRNWSSAKVFEVAKHDSRVKRLERSRESLLEPGRRRVLVGHYA